MFTRRNVSMRKQTKSKILMCFKICLILVATAMIVFGGICLKEAYGMNEIIKEMKEPLVQMPIDLSRPNKYSIALPPVREYFHGLVLLIQLQTAEKDESQLEQLVEGIGGVAIITEANDKVIHEFTVTEDRLMCYPSRRASEELAYISFLERIPEYASENSQLIIEIDQEAKKLDGIEQTLIVKYNLCGLESLTLLIVSGVGVVSTLIGLGIGILTIVSFRRKKKTRVKDSNSATETS